MAAPLPHSKPPADGLLPEGKRGPGLHLRAGTARDRRAIVELGSSLFAPFGEYRQALNGWLRSAGITTLVAEDSRGELLGFSILTVFREGTSYHSYLLGIGVHRSVQRRGTGFLLLEATIAEAMRIGRRWGVEELRLTVAESNVAAQALFARSGFAAQAGSTAHYGSGQQAMTWIRPLAAKED